MHTIPTEFSGVTAVVQANVYYDGKVVSHAIIFPDGSRKTLGVMFAGRYDFGTVQRERMEIVSGNCRVKLPDHSDWADFAAGNVFEVPGNSSFEVEIAEGELQYICSFLS